MNRQHQWVMVRVALTLVAIFACGVWVGRMTARPLGIPTPDSTGTGALAPPPPTAANPKLGRVMERYREELGLSDEQFQKIIPIFLESNEQVRGKPRRTMERLEGIEKFHRDIAAILTPSQREVADRMLEETRAKQFDD